MFDFFFILYFCIQELQTYNFMNTFLGRTRQILWGTEQMLTQNCC